MMKLEDIEGRIKELPEIIKQLETELNQLVGYRQAMVDQMEKQAEEGSKKKKSS